MDILKIVVYIKDCTKPIVLTCSEEESANKSEIIERIKKMYTDGIVTSITTDLGDIVILRPEDIKAVLITKSRDAMGEQK